MCVDAIIHPTDFSDESDQAFELACNLAREQFASLIVVHVLPSSTPNPQQIRMNFSEVRSPAADRCRQHFRRMRAFAGDIPLSFRVEVGDAVSCILQVATESAAELLVVAAHGDDQGDPKTQSSVTESLLRKSNCPVVVLRQPLKEAQRRLLNSGLLREG